MSGPVFDGASAGLVLLALTQGVEEEKRILSELEECRKRDRPGNSGGFVAGARAGELEVLRKVLVPLQWATFMGPLPRADGVGVGMDEACSAALVDVEERILALVGSGEPARKALASVREAYFLGAATRMKPS